MPKWWPISWMTVAADLVGNLLLGAADRADGLAVDGDVIGQDPGVAGMCGW